MARANASIVKNQIRLPHILVINSKRVLTPYAIPTAPLIGENFCQRVHDC